MISKIGLAFARLLKPISRGASAGDLTQKEGSNAGFTAWRKPKPEPEKPGERPGLKVVANEPASLERAASLPTPDDLQGPPISVLTEEDKARRAQAEGKKNYFGEQKSRGGMKIAKGSLYDKKVA